MRAIGSLVTLSSARIEEWSVVHGGEPSGGTAVLHHVCQLRRLLRGARSAGELLAQRANRLLQRTDPGGGRLLPPALRKHRRSTGLVCEGERTALSLSAGIPGFERRAG